MVITVLASFLTSGVNAQEDHALFFKSYCLRCHDANKQKGEFRLDSLSTDFSDISVAQRWGEVLFRMNSGEMPPKKEPQPKADELGKAVDWLSAKIKQGEATRMAKRGPVSHYRLSRDEYGYSIYDLLGVYYDVNLPGAFNEDPRWHGFNRIGSMLSLSPSHVDRYFKAAETVLERGFPIKEAVSTKGRSEPTAGNRWLLFPGIHRGNIRASAPGLYRIRVQVSALPSFKGRLPHLSLWHQGLKKSIVGQDVIAAENKPTIVEIEAFLPEGGFDLTNEVPGMLSDGHTLSLTDVPFVSTKEMQSTRPQSYKLFDEQGRSIFPLLIVDWVEWEGPILLDADRKKREGMIPAKEGDMAEAQKCLNYFASKAWRRPAKEDEIKRLMKVIADEMAAGEKFRSAYMASMVGVLTSKNFYYLEEGSPLKKLPKVNDWELASRLSYFLWGSIPDDHLLDAARSGKLHLPEVLKTQVARMLLDPKIKRFTDAFPQQWLQLHKVGMFPPDSELYPDYDKWLEKSLVMESVGYFNEVFDKNLSLREFIHSDWTMMNSRLALHYQMPPLKNPEMQRIALKPEDHRGGLLTQAGILMLTSDGTRHRPVHRGVWVSEAIFGKTPPPPPPNVEPLEPTPLNKPKATVRMQLQAHTTHAICASCHQRIDPLGFAFDNFDAIGRWRTEEVMKSGQGTNPPVNASGTMMDGRTYNNSLEFKQILLQDMDRFALAFVEQLATFALRRAMTVDDMDQIKSIALSSKKDDYKLKSVIENLVYSDLFQKR
jgi:hypothetical protein